MNFNQNRLENKSRVKDELKQKCKRDFDSVKNVLRKQIEEPNRALQLERERSIR